jgi:hypothetical protein
MDTVPPGATVMPAMPYTWRATRGSGVIAQIARERHAQSTRSRACVNGIDDV